MTINQNGGLVRSKSKYIFFPVWRFYGGFLFHHYFLDAMNTGTVTDAGLIFQAVFGRGTSSGLT